MQTQYLNLRTITLCLSVNLYTGRLLQQGWASYTFSSFMENFKRKITKQLFRFRFILVVSHHFVFFKLTLYLCCFQRYSKSYLKKTYQGKKFIQIIESFLKWRPIKFCTIDLQRVRSPNLNFT